MNPAAVDGRDPALPDRETEMKTESKNFVLQK